MLGAAINIGPLGMPQVLHTCASTSGAGVRQNPMHTEGAATQQGCVYTQGPHWQGFTGALQLLSMPHLQPPMGSIPQHDADVSEGCKPHSQLCVRPFKLLH